MVARGLESGAQRSHLAQPCAEAPGPGQPAGHHPTRPPQPWEPSLPLWQPTLHPHKLHGPLEPCTASPRGQRRAHGGGAFIRFSNGRQGPQKVKPVSSVSKFLLQFNC